MSVWVRFKGFRVFDEFGKEEIKCDFLGYLFDFFLSDGGGVGE